MAEDNGILSSKIKIGVSVMEKKLDPQFKEAFDVAYDNIYAFQLAQKAPEKSVENLKPGQIVGCKTMVLATPSSRDDSVCKEVVYWR